MSRSVWDDDCSITNEVTDKVVSDTNVLCSIMKLWILREHLASIIVAIQCGGSEE
jgi:hypothetical protein